MRCNQLFLFQNNQYCSKYHHNEFFLNGSIDKLPIVLLSSDMECMYFCGSFRMVLLYDCKCSHNHLCVDPIKTNQHCQRPTRSFSMHYLRCSKSYLPSFGIFFKFPWIAVRSQLFQADMFVLVGLAPSVARAIIISQLQYLSFTRRIGHILVPIIFRMI